MTSGPDRSYDDGSDLQEKVVQIRRVAKVVKGGRHLTFNAMVVVGDGKGRVGAGLGKGAAVPDAVRKGTTIARRNMVSIQLKDATVPHAVRAHFGASRVLLKPAPPGAGIKAGSAVRAVMEAVGVRDIVAKALGSRNPINVVKATLVGLESFRGEDAEASKHVRRTAKLSPAPERRGPVRREGGG
ncbi:MAG: 30S ribosomal protein S5, partial [Chloroflexi bacterium]|nr:30S ribosomal protein S5 [Chloroflexota bacterium]